MLEDFFLTEQLLEPALNLTVHCCGLEFRVLNLHDQEGLPAVFKRHYIVHQSQTMYRMIVHPQGELEDDGILGQIRSYGIYYLLRHVNLEDNVYSGD
ncbi:hypothetical protein Tco_0254935 [Tanacetum coccineum]